LAKVVAGRGSLTRGPKTGRWKPIAQASWRTFKERTGRTAF